MNSLTGIVRNHAGVQQNSRLALSVASRIPPARAGQNQSASWRRAPTGIRSCRLRFTECGPGCWHSPSKRRKETRRTLRELAHGRARPCALASTRSSALKTRPRLVSTAARLRIKKARGRGFTIRPSSAAQRSTGQLSIW